jgi:alpha-tubulin suppressor-like RCC1 family protein
VGLSGVLAIAAGYSHSLALKSHGTVVGWGRDNAGQATPPDGLNRVVAIAAGAYHSLALKSDGTVVGWGATDYGKATPPSVSTERRSGAQAFCPSKPNIRQGPG